MQLRKMEKAVIVERTQIWYPPEELLCLIYQHLVASGTMRRCADCVCARLCTHTARQRADVASLISDTPGLPESAEMLRREAHLATGALELLTRSTARGPDGSSTLATPTRTSRAIDAAGGPAAESRVLSQPPSPPMFLSPRPSQTWMMIGCGELSQSVIREDGDLTMSVESALPPVGAAASSDGAPLRQSTQVRAAAHPWPGRLSASLRHGSASGRLESALRDTGPGVRPPTATPAVFSDSAAGPPQPAAPGTAPGAATLDEIVTQYLRGQHAACANPIAVLPPFSLVQPHQCPTPMRAGAASVNIARRLAQRQAMPPFGGLGGRQRLRHYIYSRFRPVATFRDEARETNLTCCTFSDQGRVLVAGAQNGHVMFYSVIDGTLTASQRCFDEQIWSVRTSSDSRLLLTSSPEPRCGSRLWLMNAMDAPVVDMPDDPIVLFSTHGDLMIGSGGRDNAAHIYSTATGARVATLQDPAVGRFRVSAACFNPTDSLVLYNGTLWDPRHARIVYRFDRFANYGSGVFHPNGLECLINSEVWDLRTFKLLHTCPALDQSQMLFNSVGDVLFSVSMRDYAGTHQAYTAASSMSTSFRTFDGLTYRAIHTVDVQRRIANFAIDPNDHYVAVTGVSMSVVEPVADSAASYCAMCTAVRTRQGNCREREHGATLRNRPTVSQGDRLR